MFGVVTSFGIEILISPEIEIWLKAVVVVCDLAVLGLVFSLLRVAGYFR